MGPSAQQAAKQSHSSLQSPVPDPTKQSLQQSQPHNDHHHHHHQKPAKVIHLPPKEVQERHLRDIQKAQNVAMEREHKEDERLALSLTVPPTEAASSPSSTTGAGSTATSKMAQPSPDTSPEAESPIDSSAYLVNPGDQATSIKGRSEKVADVDMVDGPDAQLLAEQAREGSQVRTSLVAQDAPAPAGSATKDSIKTSTKTDNTPVQPPKLGRQQSSAIAPDVVMEDRPSAGQIQIEKIRIPAAPALLSTPVADPPQRLTRISSGAMRQKSVSEILGETPRPSPHVTHTRTPSSHSIVTLSRANRKSVPPTPSEERSKHSLVVFSKRDKDASPQGLENEMDGYLSLKGASLDGDKDYMRPLFMNQAYQLPRATPLQELVINANKTLSTSNLQATQREHIEYRILRRIYQLQNANKWSLRQMARFPDPTPAVCHHDHMLAEMKWMRTDFREERRWKMQMAKNLADWCQMYVEASPDVRQYLRIKAKIPPKNEVMQVIDSSQKSTDAMDMVPELNHSDTSVSDGDTPLEFPALDSVILPTPPTAIFSLDWDSVVFHVDPTPVADNVLNELPLFEPKAADSRKAESNAAAISKFAVGKLIPASIAAPRKRSRFDYEEEETEQVPGPPIKRRQSEVSLFMSPSRRSARHRDLPPEDNTVALFDPLMRHVRERLYASHAFRPPSEFSMPTTDFFEHRTPSQWTWEEDQQLRMCVKRFSYNFSLIAMEMAKTTQPSKFTAGSERRTPWECFERWVQLEGLPNDMGKTQYFRTYTSRLETAAKIVDAKKAAQQAQQPQAQTPGQIPQTRTKGNGPIRVERRRESRHVSMVDAIRKVARKRENALHRQQECKFENPRPTNRADSLSIAARNSQLRKQQQNVDTTAAQGGQIRHTPAEFSRVRQERDAKIQERTEMYRLQVLQQQKIAAQQQAQLNQQQRPAMVAAAASAAQQQQQRVTTTATPGAASANVVAGQTAAAGNTPTMQRHPSQNLMQNGMAAANASATLGHSMGSVPQAQMQANSNLQRVGSSNSENLRIALAQQNALANGGFNLQRQSSNNNLAAAHLGSPTGGALTPHQQQQQQALLAYQAQQAQRLQQQQQQQAQQQLAQQKQMGNALGSLNTAGNSTSPRGVLGQQAGANSTFSQLPYGKFASNMLNASTIKAIQQQIRNQFPTATAEQVEKLAQQKLTVHLAQMQRNASAAASGQSSAIANNGLTPAQMAAAMASVSNTTNLSNGFALNGNNIGNGTGSSTSNGLMGMTNGLPAGPNPSSLQQQHLYQQQLARHMQQQATQAAQQQAAQQQQQQAAHAAHAARMSSGSPGGASQMPRPGSSASMGPPSSHHSPAMTFAAAPAGSAQAGMSITSQSRSATPMQPSQSMQQAQQQQQQRPGSATAMEGPS